MTKNIPLFPSLNRIVTFVKLKVPLLTVIKGATEPVDEYDKFTLFGRLLAFVTMEIYNPFEIVIFPFEKVLPRILI
jgi:hypothetical protein